MMDYIEQLLTSEWQSLRLVVLERDNKQCVKCHNQSFEENCRKGVVFGSNHDFGKSGWKYQKPRKIEDNFEVKIFDFENNDMVKAYVKKIDFQRAKTFWCYYLINDGYTNIYGMKVIPDGILRTSRNSINRYIKDGIVCFLKNKSIRKLNTIMPSIKDWFILSFLHVHHTYYQIGLMAWEYPKESLETLCWQCHESVHKDSKIPIKDINGKLIGERIRCTRCHGAGFLPQYKHVENGVCFKCRGEKFKSHNIISNKI